MTEIFVQRLNAAEDIGAGTGILSMMAAKSGVDSVTACESFEPMSKIAEKIIRNNKLSDVIEVVNKQSTKLLVPDDMKERADILVTEIFDTELIGEGVLPTLRDAHQRLLSTDCKMIPSSAHAKVQLIESNKLYSMNKLSGFQKLKLPSKFHECLGTTFPHEVQINQLYPDNLKLLSNAEKINTFNFREPVYMKLSSNGMKYSSREIKIKVTASGVVHAVLFWWDLILHEEKNIVLSMEPEWMRREKYVWRDHWMQAVYYLKAPLDVQTDDVLFIKMFYDDYSLWFNVTKHQEQLFIDRPLCSCRLHILWPRERFAMLNNYHLQNGFNMLIKKLQKINKSIVVIGENSLLPLQLGKYASKEVTYVEYSQFSQPIIKELAVVNKLSNKLEIITKNETIPNDVVIVSEPYFSSSILPWHHFQIWYFINQLSNKKSAEVYPMKGCLKACLLELDDLWKVRAPVRDVEGFDLSDFDTLINNALSPTDIPGEGLFQTVEPFALWEFKHKLISNPITLVEFNFQESMPKSLLRFDGQINKLEMGTLHAVALWVEFQLDDEIFWSTGLDENKEWVNYSRQGVYFLNKSHWFKESINYSTIFIPSECEVMFSFC